LKKTEQANLELGNGIGGKSPKFDINRHSRYTAGKIQVFANVKEFHDRNIKFYGTFLWQQ